MKIKFLVSAAALALVSACATTDGPTGDVQFDQFELVAANLDFSTYEQVYLAPVTASDDLKGMIDYRPKGPSDTKRPISEKDLATKLEDLSEDLTRELDDEVTLVDAPGAGILTIAVVLDKLESNRPTMADMSAEPGLSMQSVFSGRAAVEITFSEDGTILATAEDGYSPSLNETLPPATVWSTADRYFSRLARKMADLFD